jgi:hypothetical protein
MFTPEDLETLQKLETSVFLRDHKIRIADLARAYAELREATKWIKVEGSDIPKHTILEICNVHSGAINSCMYESIVWSVVEPTHYRIPTFPKEDIL